MWNIRADDLSGAPIRDLIAEHLTHMHSQSPAESVHALDLSSLTRESVTVYSAWDQNVLGGMGALHRLNSTQAELKSMRTTAAARGRGAGRALLQHLIRVARAEGIESLWLETGVEDGFLPARTLYASEGFVVCGPFAQYTADPLSVFMTKAL